MMVARTRIIRIGNARGVRLPKAMLERTGLSSEVELDATRDRIVIRPARKPRDGWVEQFRRLAAGGDDDLTFVIDSPSLTHWDEEEWEW